MENTSLVPLVIIMTAILAFLSGPQTWLLAITTMNTNNNTHHLLSTHTAALAVARSFSPNWALETVLCLCLSQSFSKLRGGSTRSSLSRWSLVVTPFAVAERSRRLQSSPRRSRWSCVRFCCYCFNEYIVQLMNEKQEKSFDFKIEFLINSMQIDVQTK